MVCSWPRDARFFDLSSKQATKKATLWQCAETSARKSSSTTQSFTYGPATAPSTIQSMAEVPWLATSTATSTTLGGISKSLAPRCSRAHHVVGETWLCRSCCPGPTRSLHCTTCHAFRDTTLAHNWRRSNSRSNLHYTTAVHCLVDSLGRCPQRDSHKTRLSWEAVLLANDLPLLTRPLQPAALDKLQSWRR